MSTCLLSRQVSAWVSTPGAAVSCAATYSGATPMSNLSPFKSPLHIIQLLYDLSDGLSTFLPVERRNQPGWEGESHCETNSAFQTTQRRVRSDWKYVLVSSCVYGSVVTLAEAPSSNDVDSCSAHGTERAGNPGHRSCGLIVYVLTFQARCSSLHPRAFS